MGNCIARSPKVQQNRSSAKEVTSKADDVTSLSTNVVRSSNDLLNIAEPSDGSFTLFYPNLEISRQKLPNNKTVDPAASSAPQNKAPVQESPLQVSQTNVRECATDGSIAATDEPSSEPSHSDSERSSASNPPSSATASTPSSSRPAVRMYAREA